MVNVDARTVPALLRTRARERPDHVFLWSGAERMTYAEVDARSDRVAAGLAELGVTRGERLAIVSLNRPEMLELYFAAAKLGVVQVPLNAFLKGEFLRYQLADSDAATLVVDSGGFDAAIGLLDRLPGLKRVILLDDNEAAAASVELVPYAKVQHSTGPVPAVEIDADDVMSIVYTSGTTGLPKGCVLTHGYYLRVGRVGTEIYEMRADDVMIAPVPLFHAAARMLVVAATLTKGATAVIDTEFSASNFLNRAIETGATMALGVGAMFRALLAQPATELDRAHQLRLAIWTPANVPMQDEFEERFGVSVSTQLYGQTECAGVTYTPASQPRDPASGGRAAPDLDVRVVDDNDNEVPTGETGEVVFRPRHKHAMFREYWRKPEDTLAAFRGLWYHTGDFGRLDETGCLFFVDRKKDAMRRRGENVSSMELEAAIARHPKVAEVAVHAVPSDMTDDDIKACLVLDADASVTPDELFDFFQKTLPYFAIPRYVEFLPELPKNAVSRVMKHVLRERGVTTGTVDFEQLGFAVSRATRR